MSRRKLHKPRRGPFGGAGIAALAAERLARETPDGVRVIVVSDYTPGDSVWVDGLRERVLSADMPRCKDLEGQPGEGYVYAGEGYARCLPCHLGQMAAARDTASQCGRCCAAAGPVPLRPVAVQLGRWVLCSALCGLCAEFLAYEGRRSAGAAGSGSGGR
ncbi:hypothetical protein ACFWA5_21565 [Streptomyces mirabilis]|uniref:hypothetical protein n=1 Tax=Streptomyces mirabilis TaxID=68239 RepID=UPI0036626F09